MPRVPTRSIVAFSALVGLIFAACGPAGTAAPSVVAPSATPGQSPGGSLVVYSGRSESLVGPLVEQFRTETGIDVQVRYAGTSELAVTIIEEGDLSPADVFFAQDAGGLGALSGLARLAVLPDEILDRVPEAFRGPDGTWVGVSGRARVLAYDTRVLDEADLPVSIDDLTDPAWHGRLGWAPTNGSFQSFVTALRVMRGDAGALSWLGSVASNEPKVYDGNDAILAAIAAGEIEAGLVNHYYALRQAAEVGDDYPVANHFFSGGDPGALVNVAGAGILTTAPNRDAAIAFVEFLLRDNSQAYFATETFEYPLVAGVPASDDVVPLDEIQSPAIDLSDLASLEETLDLLREAGIL